MLNLKPLRKARKLTQASLAHLMGVTAATINRWETGNRLIKTNHLHKLADALSCSVADILGLEKSSKDSFRVPILSSWVEAGQFCDMDTAIKRTGDSIDISLDTQKERLFALRVTGRSMNLIAPENSIIIVDADDTDTIDGKCYIFEDHTCRTIFKRFRENPVRLEPFSSDPSFETIFPYNKLNVLGRVIMIVQNLT